MVLTSIASAERANVATMRTRSPMEHLKAAALDGLIEDGVLRPMQAMVQDWTPKLPRSG